MYWYRSLGPKLWKFRGNFFITEDSLKTKTIWTFFVSKKTKNKLLYKVSQNVFWGSQYCMGKLSLIQGKTDPYVKLKTNSEVSITWCLISFGLVPNWLPQMSHLKIWFRSPVTSEKQKADLNFLSYMKFFCYCWSWNNFH